MKWLKHPTVWLAVGALGVGAVMVLTWKLLPGLAGGLSEEQLIRSALIGDMFGFAGALFAGVGLIGVALALAFDTKDRKRSRRPFITVMPDQDRLEIRTAKWDGESLEVKLRLWFNLKNESNEPALNVQVRILDIPGNNGAITSDTLAMPLGGGGERPAVLRSRFHGSEGRDFIASMSQGTPRIASLETRYRSLTGVDWVTLVKLELLCLKKPDQEILRGVLDPESGAKIDVPDDEEFGDGAVLLGYKVVRDSWEVKAG